jgi:hypothetical protein
MGDKHDSWKAAKEFQSSKGDTPDSSKDFARAEHQARNDYQDTGGSLSNRDRSSKEDVPSRESDDSDSRVICTHLVKVGKMDRALWRADIEFTRYLSEATVRGYHFWAIPYVRLMRRYAFAEAIVAPLAIARAKEVAHVMNLRDCGSFLGRLVRIVGEPACWLLGTFVQAQDWRSLNLVNQEPAD